jgi:hypothetical protein
LTAVSKGRSDKWLADKRANKVPGLCREIEREREREREREKDVMLMVKIPCSIVYIDAVHCKKRGCRFDLQPAIGCYVADKCSFLCIVLDIHLTETR